MRKNSKVIIVSYCLLWGFHLISSGQNLETDLKAKLSISDAKKVEKANEQYAKAIKVEEEANNLLKMVLISTDNDKIKNRKKYTSKRFEAVTLYSGSNNSKINVYRTNIKKFWKHYTGDKFPLNYNRSVEKMANDSLTKASDLRYHAKKTGNVSEKLDLIIQAETIEKRFISVLGKVLFSYLNYPIVYEHNWLVSLNSNVPETKDVVNTKKNVAKDAEIQKDTTKHTSKKYSKPIKADSNKPVEKTMLLTNDSSLYGKVAITEENIDMFNKFLKKEYPNNYENYIINFKELDYSDINALRDAWYRYRYSNYGEDSSQLPGESKKSNTASDSLRKIEKYDENNNIETLGSINKSGENEIDSFKIAKKSDKSKNTESTITKQIVNDKNTISVSVNNYSELQRADTGVFMFKVQIVACRLPLNEKTIKGIYNGTEKVIELFEDSWYKYVIAQYSSYKAASNLRNRTEVYGAFVIAYLNGKRIKISPAIAYKRPLHLFLQNINPSQIQFKLQLTTSKVELDEKALKNIYSGYLKVEKINEKGLYKYQLSCGNSYNEALKILKTSSISGAYIVAYYNNNKIDIKYAIKLINKKL